MEITKACVYGASGHGKVVSDVLKRNGYTVVAFVDDDENKKEFCGLPVIRFKQLVEKKLPCALGIGNNKVRNKIYKNLKENRIDTISAVDPSAVIGSEVKIGEGTIVMPNVVINHSAIIGIGCIINSAAIIEHDCVIGDFVHISPNAALAGGVKVGSFSQVGIGSCVRQNIEIGKNTIVGAGSVVVKNIEDNLIVVGNPAKELRINNE